MAIIYFMHIPGVSEIVLKFDGPVVTEGNEDV